MEQTQELDLQALSNWDGKSPIVIINRTGQALPEVQLRKVIEATNIYGPGEFIRKHYKDYLPKEEGGMPEIIPQNQLPAIITFLRDYGNRRFEITLDQFPDHPITGAKITGSLTVNQELTDWKLNEEDFMTMPNAINFIRKRAHHLGSLKAAADMVNLFRNFEVKFETARKKADDGRGNVAEALNDELKFVAGEVPKELFITLPIFNGCLPKTLRLEIELKRRGNEVALAFYCLELETVLRNDAAEIMDKELLPFKDLFVLLEKQ